MTDNQKMETLYLWWCDPKQGTRRPAGVAFFDNEFGDYRFKIDFFPDNQYYLRCLGGDNITVRYRLEVVHKSKEGKFIRRVPVGEGYRTALGEIRISPFPFEKELVLVINAAEVETPIRKVN